MGYAIDSNDSSMTQRRSHHFFSKLLMIKYIKYRHGLIISPPGMGTLQSNNLIPIIAQSMGSPYDVVTHAPYVVNYVH
jgi:hypothetical protein